MDSLTSLTTAAVEGLPPTAHPAEATDANCGATGGGLPPVSNGIAAVAARIQERAFQLSIEQAALAEAEEELEEARLTLEKETNANAAVRRGMLTAEKERHGLELEHMQHEEEAERMEKEERELREEAESIRERAAEVAKKWDDVAAEVVAPHSVRTETYCRRAEGRIRRKKNRIQKRERRLDRLALKAENGREDAATMHRERERVRDELREMEKREEAEDENIAGQAMQIRATLNKRASLRAALEDAREHHRKANAHMLRWEEECSRLANRR